MVVNVLVLVDVLVLVLVLANFDVDQQPLPPPQANTCSNEFAAIAPDRSKMIPCGPAELPIARGSAMECATVLDVVRLLGVEADELHRQAVELLGRMVSKRSR